MQFKVDLRKNDDYLQPNERTQTCSFEQLLQQTYPYRSHLKMEVRRRHKWNMEWPRPRQGTSDENQVDQRKPNLQGFHAQKLERCSFNAEVR